VGGRRGEGGEERLIVRMMKDGVGYDRMEWGRAVQRMRERIWCGVVWQK
jgi:hypothetical protein